MVSQFKILTTRKISKAQFADYLKVSPEVLEVDVIIGSDLIFNVIGLQDFSNFLKVLKSTFEDLGKNVPYIYMAHKARHDSVDSIIPEEIENCGYFGEQVSEEDMDPDYLDRRIDIFIIDCSEPKD